MPATFVVLVFLDSRLRGNDVIKCAADGSARVPTDQNERPMRR